MEFEPSTQTFNQRLAHRLGRQAKFCTGYAPLYAELFCVVQNWINEETPLGLWICEVASTRTPFDVPMVLAAGLHYLVLRDQGLPLARYFPTAGGTGSIADGSFHDTLQECIESHADFLSHWLAQVRVQTNETGRGIGWLFPLLYTPWQTVTVADLGASAGLNLVADNRWYQFVATDDPKDIFTLGAGHPDQFYLKHTGPWVKPSRTMLPQIERRLGCDLNPLGVESPAEELLLQSFVWGDQTERMARLNEGIEAFRNCCAQSPEFWLTSVRLPEQLPEFLRSVQLNRGAGPVVLFSSYIKQYLPEKGDGLGERIERWAKESGGVIVWLQQDLASQGYRLSDPPALGWVLWSADLWQEGHHQFFPLAWCHPHGGRVQWLAGLKQWYDFWSE